MNSALLKILIMLVALHAVYLEARIIITSRPSLLKQLHPDDASSQRQHEDHQYTHKDLEESVGTDPMPKLVAAHSCLQRFLRAFHITDEGSCCHAE